jgi:hypothetical protein
MYGAAVDQDINCRIVGRCIHGGRVRIRLLDIVKRKSNREIGGPGYSW